jgi:thiamine pyrophosphate-dependent acetolactate synthase large subunit-like protein
VSSLRDNEAEEREEDGRERRNGPVSTPRKPEWGSDAIADAIVATGVEYMSLNPGASYRGLHDSLVNYAEGDAPEMLVCLHEEHAIAIAHGYAKVTERPMAAAIHTNIGLMHASMAIYNAYCDRVPMLIIGATGPMDASKRRPWIDWIHTSADLGAIVRSYVKWDDQPASVAASLASILRGNQLTRTHPQAPVYVCLDAEVQEEAYEGAPVPSVARFGPVTDPEPAASDVASAVDLLATASNPVILMGRVSRDQGEWDARVALAECLGAQVITDLKVSAAFPTEHPLHSDVAGLFISEENARRLAQADVVLSLDWVDLGGTLMRAGLSADSPVRVISATADHHLFNGWSKTDHVLGPVDVWLHSRPDRAVALLLERLAATGHSSGYDPSAQSPHPVLQATEADGVLTPGDLQRVLWEAAREDEVTLVRVPFAWNPAAWPLRGPLDYLGVDGGGGLASGPGMAVGAALALKGTGRIPIAVLGDGDYLMGLTALWSAARYKTPLLVVIANNNSYYNDEVHQQRMSSVRERPFENAHIGVRIEEPDPDLAMLAQGQGLHGIGPVRDLETLESALPAALEEVRQGGVVVVDVRVQRGYGAATAASIVRAPSAGQPAGSHSG